MSGCSQLLLTDVFYKYWILIFHERIGDHNCCCNFGMCQGCSRQPQVSDWWWNICLMQSNSNSSLKMIGINYLYCNTESDNITDLLVDLCSHNNNIVSLCFKFLVYNNILLVKSLQNKYHCLSTLGLWSWLWNLS